MAKGQATKEFHDRHDHVYTLRLNDEEWEMLQYLKNLSDFNVAAELRSTIADLYDKHYVYPPTDFEKLCAKTLSPALLKFAEYLQNPEVYNCNKEDV